LARVDQSPAEQEASMLIRWETLGTGEADAAVGQDVTLSGYPVALPGHDRAARFLLTAEPGCCPGCAPRDPAGSVEVEARGPVALRSGSLRLSGVWVKRAGRYGLAEAMPLDPPGWRGMTRRRALAAGPLMCLATGTGAGSARAALAGTTTVDCHSHAGGIANVARMRSGSAFGPVAEPMRKGGMTAVCLAVVSDGPTHKLMPDGRLHPFRTPEPGELYGYSQIAFARLLEMARAQGMAVVLDARGLQKDSPGVIVAAEGADFLEGQPDRVDEAYRRWSLRHLQLTHYRVNELGDIQTEPPVHGGLTDTGAEVIRRCNRLGIVVDVAHGTFDLVKRAVAVTTKPLVLSHTSMTARGSQFTRLITAEHARLVAQTGGLVGVWPPESVFPTMDAMAAGMARMVDAVGVDHVGLGTDMRGLVGESLIPDYDRLPALAEALARAGFGAADIGKILGGNYVRVFTACTVLS
jgi:membrane dipeptidase